MNNENYNENKKNTDNIEKQIKEQMNKAYFDLIDNTINSDKPDYEWITRLYIEIKERLCKCVKTDSKTYKLINNEFDVIFFNQLITNDVFDQMSFLNLVYNTFFWIEKLQAPYRDEYTKESKNRVLNSEPTKYISSFLKEVHSCLDNLEYDLQLYLSNNK